MTTNSHAQKSWLGNKRTALAIHVAERASKRLVATHKVDSLPTNYWDTTPGPCR